MLLLVSLYICYQAIRFLFLSLVRSLPEDPSQHIFVKCILVDICNI